MVDFTVFKGSKEGKIVQSTTTRDIKADEVLIKVTHSGLCGTDEHYRHAGIVLGHEGAGVVEVRTSFSKSKLAQCPSLVETLDDRSMSKLEPNIEAPPIYSKGSH
jgi:threonine dehydrogenase-like Zn-dependent dehydrogenase